MFLGSATNKIRDWTDMSDDSDQEKKQENFKKTADQYSRYRPEVEQARMNSYNQQASMFAPVSEMLTQMYGPQARLDLTMEQSPLPKGMSEIGNTGYAEDDAMKRANTEAIFKWDGPIDQDPEVKRLMEEKARREAEQSRLAASTPAQRSPTYDPGKV